MNKLYSLGFLLNRASFSLAKALNSEFKRHNIDLPHSQFIVLRCLYYKDALSQHDLATLLCKDAAAIKRTIDNLETKGLVTRKQVSQRQNSVLITEKGKLLIPYAIEHGESIIKKVLGPATNMETEALYKLLDKIYNNAEKI
ncbi:MAG: MarR family transcriptional regulator [Prevotella sp.]|jgi:DNA-binding MarR family transcriptional regulator|nr:MarR family transcriptional regulator [Prevotella sp.]